MDETYIKVKGKWRYLYRAIDKDSKAIDFLLTKNRDKLVAKRFLVKAIYNIGVPEKITIDKVRTRIVLEGNGAGYALEALGIDILTTEAITLGELISEIAQEGEWTAAYQPDLIHNHTHPA